MKLIGNQEAEQVSGGIWQAVLAVYAALQIADTLYTAGQAGVAGYEETRQVQTNVGQL